MEYTALAIIGFALGWLAVLRCRLERKLVIVGVAVAVLGQLAFDNYMSSLGLWKFAPQFILGVLVPIIPIENFLFGASLFMLTIASYESGLWKKFAHALEWR